MEGLIRLLQGHGRQCELISMAWCSHCWVATGLEVQPATREAIFEAVDVLGDPRRGQFLLERVVLWDQWLRAAESGRHSPLDSPDSGRVKL